MKMTTPVDQGTHVKNENTSTRKRPDYLQVPPPPDELPEKTFQETVQYWKNTEVKDTEKPKIATSQDKEWIRDGERWASTNEGVKASSSASKFEPKTGQQQHNPWKSQDDTKGQESQAQQHQQKKKAAVNQELSQKLEAHRTPLPVEKEDYASAIPKPPPREKEHQELLNIQKWTKSLHEQDEKDKNTKQAQSYPQHSEDP